jgi:hypothetical protein
MRRSTQLTLEPCLATMPDRGSPDVLDPGAPDVTDEPIIEVRGSEGRLRRA